MDLPNLTPKSQCLHVLIRVLFYGFAVWALYLLASDNAIVLRPCLFLALLGAVVAFEFLFRPRIVQKPQWYAVVLVALALAIGWLAWEASAYRSSWFRYNVLSQRVTTIVDDSQTAVILTHEDNTIRACSRKVEALTGYSRVELIGKPLTILMDPDMAVRHNESYQKGVAYLRSHKTFTPNPKLNLPLRRKDGSHVRVNLYIFGIRYSLVENFDNDIDIFGVLEPAACHGPSK